MTTKTTKRCGYCGTTIIKTPIEGRLLCPQCNTYKEPGDTIDN